MTGRVVLADDVRAAGPADQPVGEDAVLVGVQRLLDAVGREEHRPGEVRELLVLVLPGGAEVPVEVLVLLQLGVGVRRQHLAVGVDVDPRALGLLEQQLQVLQVVAGDQDALPLLRAERDLGGHRVAVGAGVAGVEQLHRPQVDLAGLQRDGDAVGDRQPLRHQRDQRVVDEAGDGVVLLAEDPGVVRVGGDALEAVEQGLLQGADVLVRIERGDEVQGRALGGEARDGCRRLERGGGLGEVVLPPAAATFAFIAFAQRHRPLDQRLEARRVEVDVGQRGEDRLEREEVGRLVDDAPLPALGGEERQALHRVHQQILQVGDLAVLAAHPDFFAPDPLDRLFALVTEHFSSPWLMGLFPLTVRRLSLRQSYTPNRGKLL